MFGGHCGLEFILGNDTVVMNSYKRSENRTESTYLDKLLGNVNTKS